MIRQTDIDKILAQKTGDSMRIKVEVEHFLAGILAA
jgi:hypothetical protein